MSIIESRYEILFLYEAKDCNPNGDPLDENRPRTDAETGQATVSDVRIKRTVRDYFISLEPDIDKRLASGKEVLVRDTFKADGNLSQGKDRAEQFILAAAKGKKGAEKRQVLEKTILDSCIDARLFGATIPLGEKEGSVKITGPVQFSAFNRSLHRVSPLFVQQTAAYAGNDKAGQKSLAERWLLPYAIIAAYGVANENAARTTGLSNADIDLLLEGLWQGTAGLNTHSKIGHDPLLLVVAEYKHGYRLGALPRRIKLSDKTVEDTALRSTTDFKLDVGELLTAWQSYPHLLGLRVAEEQRLQCRCGEQIGLFSQLATEAKLPVSTLSF